MDFSKYAEQPAFGAYFEPLNTLSNFFFIIAGIIMLRVLKEKNLLDIKGVFLCSVLIIIGIGSLLWHFYRTTLTLSLDVIPIAIFVLSFLYFYLDHIEPKLWLRLLLFALFFLYTPLITNLLITTFPVVMGNGGAGYTAAISYLVVLQIYNYIKGKKVIIDSLIIVVVFLVSLFFRQVDLHVTEWLSFGTHFMWHFLNSVTLYMMISILYYTERTPRKMKLEDYPDHAFKV